MKKSHLTKIIPFLWFVLMSPLIWAQTDSTYWYVNGEKYYWHYQKDVYAFRNLSKGPCTLALDSGCVAYKFHRSEHRDDLNIIYFKDNCPEARKNNVKQQIRTSGDFEAEFPVITLFPHLPFNMAAWFVVDDLILVNFDYQKLNQQNFEDFKNNYSLRQINYPDSVLPDGGHYTVIFEFDLDNVWPANAIDLSQAIYFNDHDLVTNVQPNLINAYTEVSDESNDVLSTKKDEKNYNVEYVVINNSNRSVKVSVNLKNSVLDLNLRVYDIFGREVFKQNLGSDKVLIDVDITDFSSGYYFSCLETQTGKVVGVQEFRKL